MVYFLVLIKRSINYRIELLQFFFWADFKFLMLPRTGSCTHVLAEVLCRQHRLPWSYASRSLTWPLLTTCFLCRTSDVGFSSILIKSVHILEAGLWHFTSSGHELHTHLIASHTNLLCSHSWKWLKLPSSFGTTPWRLVDTDFPEGPSTTIFTVVRKGWLGLTCRGRK